MTARPPSPRLGAAGAALVVLVLGLGEAALVVFVLHTPQALAPALLAHGALSAVACLAAVALWRRGAARDSVFLLFLVSAVFLGPLGVVASAFATGARLVFARRARPFAEWYDSLFPETPQSRVQALYQRLVLRGHGPGPRATVASFADIIALGTLQEKQTAISLMAARFEGGFAPALRAALNDPEAAVRVQAASAVARIEDRFLQVGLEHEARLLAYPEDLGVMRDAAAHFEALAGCGLIDEGRAQAAAEAALEMHQRIMRGSRGLSSALGSVTAAGRLLLRLGRAEEAVRLLAPAALARPPVTETIGLYLEGLFKLRRFVELRATCLALRDRGIAPPPEPAGAAFALWAADPAPQLRIEGARA